MVEAASPTLSFDPGIFLQEALLAAFPESAKFSRMHHDGLLIGSTGEEVLAINVLFDSGAISASYIDKSWLEINVAKLKPALENIKGVVRLGDNKTIAHTYGTASIVFSVVDNDLTDHRALVKFQVIDMPGVSAIIGLPDIVCSFYDFFLALLSNARKAHLESQQLEDYDSTLSALEFTINPWSNSSGPEESPEETNSYDPTWFPPDILCFLEKPHQEALDEYHSALEKHISPEVLSAVPQWIEYMKTDICIRRFVPDSWTGIKGIEPIELDFLPSLPDEMKPPTRIINPNMLASAKKEFYRMSGYMLTYSDSPRASPLVTAPKATEPFVRLCGDYKRVNVHIPTGKYPIPHVQTSIFKARSFSWYVDIDWANSFHQFKLGDRTSNILSIQTPWGLVRPLFMPEGVGPASGILQSLAASIYRDFDEWTIAIFDNLLILANSPAELFDKFKIIIQRSDEYNVVFKLAKTFIGFREVTFFGYVISGGKYAMSAKRKQAIMDIPFPANLKQMQRFLGAVLIFKSFVPNFSILTAELHDTVHASFNWDSRTWTVDYRDKFETFKLAIVNATAVYFPNYDLNWLVRCDASDRAVGSVLIQEVPVDDPPNTFIHQPIGFASQKFSDQAMRWDAFKKEAYAVYFSVVAFAFLLRGKFFILESDHRNLIWIEQSDVAIVIRWRVYLQSFIFLLRHIAGRKNLVADWASRLYSFLFSLSTPDYSSLFSTVDTANNDYSFLLTDLFLLDDNDEDVDSAPEHCSQFFSSIFSLANNSPALTIDDILRSVHGGRNFHWGARQTWLDLNKKYPGHQIPYRVVADFVATCPTCQKDRLGMTDSLPPLVRHLKLPHHRKRIGVDTLTITPADINGNDTLTVVVNQFSHHCKSYPSSDKTADSLATALFQYLCTFGVFDELISDPGSDLMSDVVNKLNTWFGMSHIISLVDRHQSCGVEGSNKQILRHLKTLVHDERLCNKWSSPTVLPLIDWAINDHLNSETGYRPFDLTFGTEAGTYCKLPSHGTLPDNAPLFLQSLDSDLNIIRELTVTFQFQLAAERTAGTPAELQNKYQPGDYVLFLQVDPHSKVTLLPTKLSSPFLGPYEVLQQDKNDVKCKHVVMGFIKTFHVERLKIFHGTKEEAFNIALQDADQHIISEIKAYRGDPLIRTTVQFLVQFADNDVIWIPFSQDLFKTVQYETYCRSIPCLYPLIFNLKEANSHIKAIKMRDITSVAPGDTVYVLLRWYNHIWYDSLPLPDLFDKDYLLEFKYVAWTKRNSKKKITAICPVFNDEWKGLDNYFVFAYGSKTSFNANDSILIDNAFVKTHSRLFATNNISSLSVIESPIINATIKILSWNVDSIRSLIKSHPDVLDRIIDNYSPDIICFQETKLQSIDVSKLKEHFLHLGYLSFWSCSTLIKGYAGTAILIRNSICSTNDDTSSPFYIKNQICDLNEEGRIIILEFNCLYLVNVYVPNSGSALARLNYRLDEWDKFLFNYLERLDKEKPVILTADLNVAHLDIDIFDPSKNNIAGVTDQERSSFSTWFENSNFLDAFRFFYPNDVHQFTNWKRGSGNREFNRGFRFDYILASSQLFSTHSDNLLFKISACQHLQKDSLNASDHCPVLLTLTATHPL